MTPQQANELCPHCGKPPRHLERNPGLYEEAIVCDTCRYSLPPEVWNRRAPAPTSEPGARDADDQIPITRSTFGTKEACEAEHARRVALAVPVPVLCRDWIETLSELVSDFRKATYEFARGHDPEDYTLMMERQGQIFALARSVKPASPAVPAAPLAPSDAILKARAEGRAEAVQIIIDMDAEDALSELTGWSSPVGPEDEGSAYWDLAKLREKFSCDDVLLNLFDKAEIMYWEASAERDEAARAKAFAENMGNSAKVRDILSKANEFDLIGQLCRAADPAPLVAQASPWISVEDRLPYKATDVLITDNDQIVIGYQRYNLGFTDWYDSAGPDDIESPLPFIPTHWMPLPPAPEASPLVEDAQRIVTGKVEP